MENVPEHLGIIMDGNRRWAKKKGLPTLEGHRRGAEKLKEVVRWCKKRGIKVLTVYAFSTENWNRLPEEINFLMWLLNKFLDKQIPELRKEKVKLKIIGQREKLPKFLQKNIEKAENLTSGFNDFILVLAVSYGGKDEIVRAVKKAILEKRIKPGEITEEKIEICLDTADLPNLDLIIRTGGEQRISNFLIWQSAYAEFYFSSKYWPDFTEKDLDQALADFARRERKFGK